MSLKVASSIPISTSFTPVVLRETERALTQQSRPLQTRGNNSMETEIISKLNNIAEFLKDLEGNFSKVRQDLIRKNTIEGRENDKICAVNGKIVSNKKKYYKSLEEDVDTLSKAFQDQFKKISNEFNLLQALSKGKPAPIYGSSSDNLTLSDINDQLEVVSSKAMSMPSIYKVTKFNEVKTSPSNKETLPQPFKLRASPEQEPIEARKVSFGKISQLNERTVEQLRTFPQAYIALQNKRGESDGAVKTNTINQEFLFTNKSSLTYSTQNQNKRNEPQRYYNNEVLNEMSLDDSSLEETLGDALSYKSTLEEHSSGRIMIDNIYDLQNEIKF